MSSNSQKEEVRKEILRGRARVQHQLIQEGVWSCCLNCSHWDLEADICLRFGSLPPVEVVLVGCEEWDDTPF